MNRLATPADSTGLQSPLCCDFESASPSRSECATQRVSYSRVAGFLVSTDSAADRKISPDSVTHNYLSAERSEMTLNLARGHTRRTLARGLAAAALGPRFQLRSPAEAGPALIRSAGADLQVYLNVRDFDLPQQAILGWVDRCARAVGDWLGRFPVRRARIHLVQSRRDGGVEHGTSWGSEDAECRISLGARTTESDLNRDWVLTHEMFHFAFPSVPDKHRWIEEGISTYAEPIARAAAGMINREQVWRDMIRDMPQGLPTDGDRGLDQTHTWARTYWGGALFCLLADIGIRKATANRRGLRDALQGINLAGGNITAKWPLARALETADHATGTTVLSDLYQTMGSSYSPVDLARLWKELGVSMSDGEVRFDDGAPLAAIRTAMVANGAHHPLQRRVIKSNQPAGR